MKHPFLLSILLISQLIMSQIKTSEIKTTWYEVNKISKNNYAIIDCNYRGEEIKITDNKIFEHGVMEDSEFEIESINVQGNSTYIFINKERTNYYRICLIMQKKGIVEISSNINSINTKRFFVNKKNKLKIKRIKGNSQNCI